MSDANDGGTSRSMEDSLSSLKAFVEKREVAHVKREEYRTQRKEARQLAQSLTQELVRQLTLAQDKREKDVIVKLISIFNQLHASSQETMIQLHETELSTSWMSNLIAMAMASYLKNPSQSTLSFSIQQAKRVVKEFQDLYKSTAEQHKQIEELWGEYAHAFHEYITLINEEQEPRGHDEMLVFGTIMQLQDRFRQAQIVSVEMRFQVCQTMDLLFDRISDYLEIANDNQTEQTDFIVRSIVEHCYELRCLVIQQYGWVDRDAASDMQELFKTFTI